MITSIDFSRVETALSTRLGWVELAIVGLCFAAGWLVDRRFRLDTHERTHVVRAGLGSVNRLIFPLTSLALLAATLAAFRHFHPPFFLSLALPLAIALALIRLCVYALRGIFGNAAWMHASERTISFSIWGVLLLYYIGVLPEIGSELDSMQLPIGKDHVSVLDILKSVLAVLVTMAVTISLSGLIERRLIRAETVDLNLRVVLSKLVRALMLVAAFLIALSAVGIDLTLLSVFGGALGVGIGLGLQKLASNYIAGFTILLDRSVRMGDMVTVDNRFGIISRVTARYVVVRGLDGVEAIVPNETLVTTTVLNHSYHSKDIRVAIPVQVSYDCDLERALALMEEVARGEARVLKMPNPPTAFVVRFADSGIDLELGIWIADPENGQLNLRSAINLGIWRAFKANGIRIPFPQREVRIVGDVASAGVQRH